jgi:hypothetical protein
LWTRIASKYDVTDAGGVELLTLACQSLDRAEGLRAQIDEDGEVLYIKGIPKAHPAVRDEINCRAFIARSLSRLGLAVEVSPIRNVGRPPIGGYGVTAEDLAAMREQDDE